MRSVRLVFLALAATLALGALAQARAGDPIIDELIQNAKVDTTITPADPSLPEEVKAWLGRWEGSFLATNGTQVSALIVKKIGPPTQRNEYPAKIVMVRGPSSNIWGGFYAGGAYELDAVVRGRTLTHESRARTTTYTMRPDMATLDGQQTNGRGWLITGVLTRTGATAGQSDARKVLDALRQSGALNEEQYRQALERLGK